MVPARVGDDQLAQAPDIYQTKEVTRQIYSIRANVEPGNSGGPLLAPNGQVDGVVFAAAVGVKDTGYALTASEVASDARAGGRQDRPASPPGRVTSDPPVIWSPGLQLRVRLIRGWDAAAAVSPAASIRPARPAAARAMPAASMPCGAAPA